MKGNLKKKVEKTRNEVNYFRLISVDGDTLLTEVILFMISSFLCTF